MASEVQQFAERLSEQLITRHRHSGAGREYVLVGDMQRAIAEALPPADLDEQYPRMVYRGGSRTQTCIVNDASEEAAAAVEGYQRTPLPPSEPKYFCELPRSQGGTSYDLRRVIIFTAEEEAQFRAAVEDGDWIVDTVDNPHGARGVALSDVIAERKALLKAMIDAQPLAPATEDIEATQREEQP